MEAITDFAIAEKAGDNSDFYMGQVHTYFTVMGNFPGCRHHGSVSGVMFVIGICLSAVL